MVGICWVTIIIIIIKMANSTPLSPECNTVKCQEGTLGGLKGKLCDDEVDGDYDHHHHHIYVHDDYDLCRYASNRNILLLKMHDRCKENLGGAITQLQRTSQIIS